MTNYESENFFLLPRIRNFRLVHQIAFANAAIQQMVYFYTIRVKIGFQKYVTVKDNRKSLGVRRKEIESERERENLIKVIFIARETGMLL